MNVTFHTVVLDVPATPLGMLPRSFVIDHWCNECKQRVGHDDLIGHARAHGAQSIDQQEGSAIK